MISRRAFIKKQVNWLTAALGMAAVAETSGADEAGFPDMRCRGGNERRILVVYDSSFGSTKEVGEWIGKTLCRAGFRVDVRWVGHVHGVQSYEGVILGGAIQYDRWMSGMRDFLERHRQALAAKETAYFFTCMTLSKKTEEARMQAAGYVRKLRELSDAAVPLDVGQFAGVLDYSKMSWGQRVMARPVFFTLGIEEGDYRDRGEIEAWAKRIGSAMG